MFETLRPSTSPRDHHGNHGTDLSHPFTHAIVVHVGFFHEHVTVDMFISFDDVHLRPCPHTASPTTLTFTLASPSHRDNQLMHGYLHAVVARNDCLLVESGMWTAWEGSEEQEEEEAKQSVGSVLCVGSSSAAGCRSFVGGESSFVRSFDGQREGHGGQLPTERRRPLLRRLLLLLRCVLQQLYRSPPCRTYYTSGVLRDCLQLLCVRWKEGW